MPITIYSTSSYISHIHHTSALYRQYHASALFPATALAYTSPESAPWVGYQYGSSTAAHHLPHTVFTFFCGSRYHLPKSTSSNTRISGLTRLAKENASLLFIPLDSFLKATSSNSLSSENSIICSYSSVTNSLV